MITKGSTLERLVRVHKALAHPFRLRILAMLADGELCVCQIVATLKVAPSTVSAHLSELRDTGLVLEEKEGRWVRCRLADDPESERLLAELSAELRTDARIAGDRRILRELRKVPIEKLCRADLDLARLGLGPQTTPAGARPTSRNWTGSRRAPRTPRARGASR